MIIENMLPMRRSRGGTGGPDAPEKSQNIGFLSNIGPDPLKIIMLPSQHSLLGNHQHSSEMPFKWRFVGWPMIVCL